MAAILGNVLVVFPAALVLSLLWWQMFGATPLDAAHAQSTLDSLHVLGPSALFAAYTGVL